MVNSASARSSSQITELPARVVVFVDESGTTRLSALSDETFRIVDRIR